MIISHRHRYIFLMTTKTAGTSIEIALSKFCGPDDVITPIVPEDEATSRELGYRSPQNYLATIRAYRPHDLVRLLRTREPKRWYSNHIGARKVRRQIGEAVWSSYFKFCVARNPWDRVVSHYYWTHTSEDRPTLTEYLDSSGPAELARKGYGLYTIDGEVVVDRICHYENLADELEEVRLRVGLPEPLSLPRAKAGYRKSRGSYRESFSDADRDRVAALFADEIRLLGYEF